jgi:hypothetical protein
MDSNVNISLLSGDKKDLEIWSIQYRSEARLKGNRILFTGVNESPEKGTKSYQDFMLSNIIAFSELINACSIAARKNACLKEITVWHERI